jgi:hypothetical protein
MAKRKTAALLLLLLAAAVGFAEEERPPEEYDPQEFSPFLQDLRRGEIIFFGSLPMSLFVCFEVYDISRYFYVRSRDGADEAREYAPWPVRRYGGKPYGAAETKWILVSALSLSLCAALVDFMIGNIREKRNTRQADPNS